MTPILCPYCHHPVTHRSILIGQDWWHNMCDAAFQQLIGDAFDHITKEDLA